MNGKIKMYGGENMREYIVRFTLNGKTLETSVRANSYNDAKNAVKMQYSGERVAIINCKDMTNGHYG